MADVKMPKLGESVTEGTLGKWFKKVGDMVAKYEPLVEVVTDKVNAEIPSDFEGVLTEILVQEGETVVVGTVVCRVGAEGNNAQGAVESTPASQSATIIPVPEANHIHSGGVTNVSKLGSGRFSPAVLRLAEENNVNLANVIGTGENGRITRKDVQLYIQNGSVQQVKEGLSGSTVEATLPKRPVDVVYPAEQSPSVDRGIYAATSPADETIIEPSTIRRTIARRMVESKHNAPHAWMLVEVDVTDLARFRDSVKADFKRKEGIDITYLPFFIKAVAEGLKQYPMLNAAWIDDKIHVKKHINISIAVATDDALVVPVIHDADRLSIAGIAHQVQDLARRARSNKLNMTDVQGGTFTVNNTGAFGSVMSQPIINAPQAAILSVESIVKRPVVVGDAIAIRHMVNVCMSLDHRVLDGWVCGQFLKVVKERLQAYGKDTQLY